MITKRRPHRPTLTSGERRCGAPGSGRVSSGIGGARWAQLGKLGRGAEMAQDPLDHGGFFDQSDQAQAPATARTGQHVEAEAAAHQVGPQLTGGPGRSRRTLPVSLTRLRLGHAGIARAGGLTAPDQQGSPRRPGRQHPFTERHCTPRRSRRRSSTRGSRGRMAPTKSESSGDVRHPWRHRSTMWMRATDVTLSQSRSRP